jgi:hypothetical protein
LGTTTVDFLGLRLTKFPGKKKSFGKIEHLNSSEFGANMKVSVFP